MHLRPEEREALELRFNEHRPRRARIFIEQRAEFFSGFFFGVVITFGLGVLAATALFEIWTR